MAVVLYKRQRQVFDFLTQYIQNYGRSPSLREIADAMGLKALSTIHEHLAALERKGVIQKLEGKKSGVKIIDDSLTLRPKAMSLPVLGFIAAGKPIEPYTDPNATFQIPKSMLNGRKRAYILQVSGDSMIEDGILDGDNVVVEEGHNIKNGDLVIALLENSLATLKRFFQEATRIRLEPSNSSMRPIYTTNVQIQGKVVGLIRKY